MFMTDVSASFVSGAVGGVLMFLLVVKGLWSWHHQPQALVTFGPPLALLLFGLSATLEIGLLGRRLEEDEREWWARVGALFLLAATFWLLLFVAVLYIPWLINLADDRFRVWLKSGLSIGWLVTSVGGAVAGRSPATGNDKGTSSTLKEMIAEIAPWVFVVGLLAAISMLVGFFVDANDVQPDQVSYYWARVGLASAPSLLAWFVGSALFALMMSSLVDVNLFSLHNMYANRLIRATSVHLEGRRPGRTAG